MPLEKVLMRYGIPTVIGGIIIYIIFGLLTTIVGIDIYDDLPNDDIMFNTWVEHTFIIQNSAPFSFPHVNPSFKGGVRIEDNLGNVSCSLITVKGKLSCKETIMNVGYIAPGDTQNIQFVIDSHNQSFKIKFDVYLSLFLDLPIKSKTLECTTSNENKYLCK